MAIFGPEPQVNPFGKMSVFQLCEIRVSIAQKGIFSFQNIVKDIFLVHISKKKVGKMAIFAPKLFVNLFRKMSILRLFELLIFYSQERHFFVLEYRKRHFPCLYCQKKKLEKWPFLDQNHVLTPLEKCQLFQFLNFLFLQPGKAFFRSRIS